MFDDDSPPSSRRPAARLLDELESIKGALTDDHDADNELPADIPLLDDMVIDHLDSNAELLDIEHIFGENAGEEKSVETSIAEPPMQFPRFTLDVSISDDDEVTEEKPSIAQTTTARLKPRVRPDYSREVLIQELVDEFIPRIEAELHRRLQQLDDADLRRLKDSN